MLENFREHQAFSHLSSLATLSMDLNDEQMHLELKDIKKHFEKTIQKHKIARLRKKKSQTELTTEEKIELVNLLTNQIT